MALFVGASFSFVYAGDLQLKIVDAPDQQRHVRWNDLGADWGYTLEARDALSATTAFASPAGTIWPTRRIDWRIIPGGDPAQQFFRVRATQLTSVERGKLISSSLITNYASSTLALFFAFYGIPVTQPSGVELYKVIYQTIDPGLNPIQASGVLALPQNPTRPLPLFSYQHGSLIKRTDAPSQNTEGEALAAVVMGASGYVALVPDYLGLGDGPGFHPYHHARSEATATIDLLRAAQAFCLDQMIPLNQQLFIAGYSQGGHATMATHWVLETENADEFQITASAPMAGAYDMSGVTATDFLSDREMPNPYYFAYLMAAYVPWYRLAGSLAEILAEPYATVLPPLLDGSHSADEINAVMPSRPIQILKPAFADNFRNHPNNPLWQALKDNDLYNWAPQAPMRLYHCSGDQDVLYANSEVALAAFHKNGALQVTLIDPLPGGSHSEGSLPSLLAARAWFETLKQ
jgi:hypothetical protein